MNEYIRCDGTDTADTTAYSLDPVKDAYLRFMDSADLLLGNGRIDLPALRELIVTVLSGRIVTDYADREGKALARAELALEIFPSLTDFLGDLADKELADGVRGKVLDLLWFQTAPGYKSAIQLLLKRRLGKEYVLIRAKVGTSSTLNSVYVTKDTKCVTYDFEAPLNQKMMDGQVKASNNIQMLMEGDPANAAARKAAFEEAQRAAGAITGAKLTRALTAATTDIDSEPGVN